MPKIVSASPVATWLATSERVSTAKISESAIAAAAPATMPIAELPVIVAVAKAVTAPVIIIPSTPRLRTPDFSVTSSPSAA